MIYYKHFIGDFQRDTGHLSLTERGAYRALLDGFYATERPLPLDMTQLCRMVGAVSKAERDALKRILEEFWIKSEEGWTNARAAQELAKSEENRETNRRLANRRWSKRSERSSHNENSTNGHPNRNAIGIAETMPSHSHSHSHSQSQNLSETSHEPVCVMSSLPVAKSTREEPDEKAEFSALKAKYPPNSGRTDWITAEHHIRRHIANGSTWREIHEGVERYARLVTVTNRMVLNPARFFGDSDKPWAQPWPLPTTKAQNAQDSNVAAARAWLEKSSAAG